MKKVMLKTTLSLAVTLASTQLFASGFALNEQSISGMGTGFAGRSSSADDASTIYGNPAGMARLKGQQVTVGVASIDAKTDIKNAGGRSRGSNDGDMVPFTSVPMGFYTNQINDQWSAGVGIYAPFGLVTDYEGRFQGRGFGSKSEVKVVTVQPTISYAFNDKVSIGFGPTINRISGELQSDLTLNPAFGDTNVRIKGDDTALGFNAGILVQATDSTRVGLTYHSKVKYKLDGHTDITAGAGTPGALLQSARYDASLKIETPESYDLSVTQDINDAWKVYAGTTWTRWSRLKDITVNNQGVTASSPVGLAPTLFGTISEPQNWHDTWAYALGTSYQLNKQWVVRTGLTFDQAPTNNTDRSPRIPTGDRTIISAGLGYAINDNLTIDAAISYLKEEEVSVNKSNTLASYSADYKNSAWGYGLGATYKF
ncbi:outer membrane protein transport protein [Pseudomonas gingeri]|uniref:OmpP1/FadL family transporter n=1 Tax=Pseudomonas gingeri TaxID=117681 RepID=UPI0015BF69C9|nr:outer membrane protein transport protein [Pseudomonas gingeri]NWE71466.1 outer membrane protein transport protein [Pseudomonas gingeri]